MSARLAQRLLALGAIALLGGVGAYALAARGSTGTTKPALPRPVVWYSASAGVRGTQGYGRRSACGDVLTDLTLGVTHPVLPCGAKIFIAFRGKQVLTQVVARGPIALGREFNLTRGLADRLGLHGVQRIRWSFAAG
jgi:hypothetical protein